MANGWHKACVNVSKREAWHRGGIARPSATEVARRRRSRMASTEFAAKPHRGTSGRRLKRQTLKQTRKKRMSTLGAKKTLKTGFPNRPNINKISTPDPMCPPSCSHGLPRWPRCTKKISQVAEMEAPGLTNHSLGKQFSAWGIKHALNTFRQRTLSKKPPNNVNPATQQAIKPIRT